MNDIKEQLVKIIRDISPNIKMTDEELLRVAYLEQGLIDSFQLIEMISKLESDFFIRFSAEELESEDFRELLGVIKIIKEKI